MRLLREIAYQSAVHGSRKKATSKPSGGWRSKNTVKAIHYQHSRASDERYSKIFFLCGELFFVV